MSKEKDSSGREPGTYNDVPINYNSPWDAVRQDPNAPNSHISNLGIKFVHYICVPDPLYQVNLGSIRQSFDQEEDQQFSDRDEFYRENGFLYFKKGYVYGIFQNNTKDLRSVPAGLYSHAGATIALNRHYENSEEKVKVTENDKFIPCELPKEFFSVNWQKIEHNPTGIDRLEFKACEVIVLIDSSGVIYSSDIDFTIENGSIKWISSNRPGLDPLTGKGKICSVRYTYQPSFYAMSVLHDIRIRPALNLETGNLETKAGPLLVQIAADWIYLDKRTANDGDVAAQLDAADTDNTGPR